ncbi:MAG: AMP-binding protein [Flavobacteriaceae bacterium]|nr:AMP-binding protein [Flavobacteriaceae bacterium]
MIPNYNKIHNDFKLNGIQFTREKLNELAHNYAKEGEHFEIAIGIFLIDWLDESPTITVSTSGSTGLPKDIVLSKQAMVYSALETGEFFNLKPGNTALLCLSCSYIAGKMMLVRAMVLGLEIDAIAPKAKPLDHIRKHIDFVAMVPKQLEESIDMLGYIKTLIVGGAKVSERLIIKIQEVQTAIYETYGMTETITHVAVRRLNQNSVSKNQNFKVFPNIKVSQDERDCLIIDAPLIAKELVVTNDVVNLISENEFKWLGRYDNVINSGGIKLFPEQIEAKLVKTIHARFFITAAEDETLGEAVTLVIEGKNDKYNNLKFDFLDKYEKPKGIVIIEKFVETESGKIQRAKTLALSSLSKI